MSDRSLSEMEEFFLALSDGTRLRLLSLMRDGEVSVGYLSERLCQSQPKISRHLAYLRSAGLVQTRRDGKWVYYHISDPPNDSAFMMLSSALDWVADKTGSARTPENRSRDQSFFKSETETENEDVDVGNYSNDIEIYLL